MKHWNETLQRATSLEDLLRMLVAIDEELEPGQTTEDVGISLTNLPVFGGQEPDNTSGVWSWDETSLLVDLGGSVNQLGQRWEIIARSDH